MGRRCCGGRREQKQSGTGSQNSANQFSQEQTQDVDVPGGMAKEAMKPTPMPVANIAAGEDDLGQIAVPMSKSPAIDNLDRKSVV